MSFTDEELRTALIAAHNAGDADVAREIANRLSGSRTIDKSGPRGMEEKRWRDLGNTEPLYPPSEASTMSGPQRALAALDYGLESVPHGIAQLAANLMPGVDATKINELEQDRARVYESGGLADYTGANAARMGGEVAAFALPGGLGAKIGQRVAGLAPKVLAPVIEGATIGASEGLSMPVTGDDYWGDKSAQVAMTAPLGAGISSGLSAATRGGEAVVNTGRRAQNLPGELVGRQRNQGSAVALEGDRLATQYDVPLTPGQRSDSTTLKFMEQRARESVFSSAKAAEGDLIRANKFQAAVEQVAGDADSVSFAANLQGRITGFVQDLARTRSKTGRKMYGAIDNMTGGKKIVQPRNLYDELNSIIQEAGTQEGGDVVRAAKQAKKMLETIDQQGGYTAQEALGRLQTSSPFSKASLFRKVNMGYDAQLKRRIYGALMKDMEETAATSGSLGDMVKAANAQWRKFSTQIDAIHKSALGRMVGDDFATDLMNFSTVAPEQVMDQFMRLRPTQAKYVAKFMQDNMPDQLPKLQKSLVQDAIDAAMEAPATGGADTAFNPGGFLRALGLTGNKRGGESMKRLMHIFGGENSQAWGEMKDLITISRRMADVYGKNFSGTSQSNQVYTLIRAFGGKLSSLGKVVGSTLMEGTGLRRVADSMNPDSALFGNLAPVPLVRAPRVIQGAPVPASILGTIPGAAVAGD